MSTSSSTLLNGRQTTILGGLRGRFAEDITLAWTDLILVLNCFTTGLLDSAVFNVWECFVSMQTGNTVYLGLGFASQPTNSPYRWAKALTAIVSFIFGSFCYSRSMRALGSLRRSTLILSTLLQASAVFLVAILSITNVVPEDAGDRLPDDCIVLLPLALLAFQAGGQCVLSRILGYGEVTTVVLTSAYCDLVVDENAFQKGLAGNSKRNRRIGSVVFLLAGAIAGGFLTREGDLVVVLWIVGGLKVGYAVVWGLWKAEGGVRLD